VLRIVMPMAGGSQFFTDSQYGFPKPLVEILEKSMVQIAIENFTSLENEAQFVFIVQANDCDKYHLDNVLKLLTNDNCVIIKVTGEKQSAACSALMAIDSINNADPIIIANSDQQIEENIHHIVTDFEKSAVDAGVVTFETIHPRWSYVRMDENGKIIEAAEKKPISRHAIAGLYYFRKGSIFVDAAMKSIQKDAHVNGLYYIAPVLNELILEGYDIQAYGIDRKKYHTFYTPQKIAEYERLKDTSIGKLTEIIE